MKIYLLLTGENDKEYERARVLLEEFINGKILITGKSSFNKNVEKSEAKKYKEYIEANAKQDIILEEKALDTIGNMVFSKPIIEKYKPEEVIIVTDSYHMLRSTWLFKKVMPNQKMRTLKVKNLIKNILYFPQELILLLMIKYDFWKNKIVTSKQVEEYMNSYYKGETKYKGLYVKLASKKINQNNYKQTIKN